jgi:hypothetical protein
MICHIAISILPDQAQMESRDETPDIILDLDDLNYSLFIFRSRRGTAIKLLDSCVPNRSIKEVLGNRTSRSDGQTNIETSEIDQGFGQRQEPAKMFRAGRYARVLKCIASQEAHGGAFRIARAEGGVSDQSQFPQRM